MSVVEAVERDLEAFGDLAQSALAASALALARELDSGKNSATSKAMCAKALNETMDRLRELAPPKVEEDEVERARKRRAARLARKSASGAAPPSP